MNRWISLAAVNNQGETMTENSFDTVGDLLRKARGTKRFTLEQVNRRTRISVDVLEALEQDDLESFESDIYLKGFLKNYASFLGLDVADVLRTLDRQRGGGKSTGGALWDTEEDIKEEKLKSPRIFKRFILPLLLVLILALVFLWINERRKVKRLTGDDDQSYLERVTTETRCT